MKNKISYLYERKYNAVTDGSEIIDERLVYWEKLLGESVVETLKMEYPNFVHYLHDHVFQIESEKSTIQELVDRTMEISKEVECEKSHHNMFYMFVEPFAKLGVHNFIKETMDIKEVYEESVLDDFQGQLSERLQYICSRTLIAEIHEYKDKGLLRGGNSKEEYDYFCDCIIGSSEYMENLSQKYPVLFRCIWECVDETVTFYDEIIRHFKKDAIHLRDGLISNQSSHKISHIISKGSDVHNHGKQVMTVEMDCGEKILYKPHSMENEKTYEGLYNWLQKEAGLETFSYAYLSRKDHSWSAIVSYQSCQSEEMIRRYYQRIGIHLLLAYLLGTNDLHNENIIAAGEYPVLIDLETIADGKTALEGNGSADAVYNQLMSSVLYTGLLPYHIQGHAGMEVDSSGIAGNDKQQYSFKVPRIMGEGTSEIYIDYIQPVPELQQNRVTFRGKTISPVQYISEIELGFKNAYEMVQQNKEHFFRVLGKQMQLKSRALVADTQRYTMLLSSSYHPSLMKDGAEREIFLYSLWDGRDNHALVDLEVRALLCGDIPQFYRTMNGLDLCSEWGRIRDYFSISPYDAVTRKIHHMTCTDMNKQCQLIRTSLELIPENQHNNMNSSYEIEGIEYPHILKKDIKSEIHQYVERLLNYAVWNPDKTEVNWSSLQLSAMEKDQWYIQPMDMYLYHGLAGMLYLFYYLKEYDHRLEVKRIFQTLRNMLFQYTDQGNEDLSLLQSRNTGIYQGESSIPYVYVVLYHMSGEKAYLSYAKKHMEIVKRLVVEDENHDLLSGNAGLIQVLLLLYKISQENYYLEMAKAVADILYERASPVEHGIGWSVDPNIPPMAGMAHGNSGVLMVIAELWKQTGNLKYERWMSEILDYENSLYDATMNNWVDTRKYDQTQDPDGPIAWCHGVGGILISRMNCYAGMEKNSSLKEVVEKDMKCAYKKLKENWRRDSISLCHGSMGNLWILEEYEKRMDIKAGSRNIPAKKIKDILPQERLNPGLMNGYGGTLLYLLHMDMGMDVYHILDVNV